MSASITKTAATYSAVYGRRIEFGVTRSDPAGSQVSSVKTADASDVATHGNGLEVGDILVTHATIQGPIAATVGQTLILTNCGEFTGIHKITKLINQTGGTRYLTIDAPSFVDFSGSGTLRIWLNNYHIKATVNILSDLGGSVVKTINLTKIPDDNGVATFNVATVLRRGFEYDDFGQTLDGGGMNTRHAKFAAIAYTVSFEEAFDDLTGATIWNDTTNELVAVNAVHPHSGPTIDYSSSSLADFEVGGTGRKFLTHLNRTQQIGLTESFTLTMLNDDQVEGLVRFKTLGGSTIHDEQFQEDHPAIAWNVGPADVSGLFTIPADGYKVQIRNLAGSTEWSEEFTFMINSKCGESNERFACLNKLGGIDQFTFHGRKVQVANVKRRVLKRSMGNSGELETVNRVYRVDSTRGWRISSRLMDRDRLKEIGESLLESVLVMKKENGVKVFAILDGDGQEVYNTRIGWRTMTIEYYLGVDNINQER